MTRLDSEVDSLAGYRSPMRGTPPQLRVAATRPEEFGWPAERIGSWLALGIEPQAFVRRPTRKSSSQAPASPHAVSEPEPLPRDRDIAPPVASDVASAVAWEPSRTAPAAPGVVSTQEGLRLREDSWRPLLVTPPGRRVRRTRAAAALRTAGRPGRLICRWRGT